MLALSSSRFSPPAAASSDSTRALKPVLACKKFWECAQRQGQYGARSKAIAYFGHELGTHVMPARVVGRSDRDGGVAEVPDLTAHAQEKEGEKGVWGGGEAGQVGQATHICDSTCCLTCARAEECMSMGARGKRWFKRRP